MKNQVLKSIAFEEYAFISEKISYKKDKLEKIQEETIKLLLEMEDIEEEIIKLIEDKKKLRKNILVK